MEAFKQNNTEASDSDRRKTWLELDSTGDSGAIHRIFDVIHSPMARTLHMQNRIDDDGAAGATLTFDGVSAIPCGEISGGRGMDGHSPNGIHLPMRVHGASGFVDGIPSLEIRGDPVCFVSRSPRTSTTRHADEAAVHSPDIWYYDTAASFSMTGNLRLLQGIHATPLVTATSATGHTVSSELCGRVSGTVNLSGVRYFPGAPNLISAGHLIRQLGCGTSMKRQSCTITNQDGIVVGIVRILDNNVMVLDMLGDYSLGSTCSVCPRPWNHN